MGIREIVMLYLTTFFAIAVLLTDYLSHILNPRFQRIKAKLPITLKSMLVVLYLTSIVSAGTSHEPQVYEDLHEDMPMPEVIRKARHLGKDQQFYQPPVFNYRTASQQDPMKSKYYRQQQADFRHLKIKTINPDEFFEHTQNRGTPLKTLFDEDGSDWKPFQPQYIPAPKAKSHFGVVGKSRFSETKQNEDFIEVNSFASDLDTAGSDNIEEKVKEKVEDKVEEKTETKPAAKVETDRQDHQSAFIYVQPNILKNNFGMDSRAIQEMLKNAAPAVATANAEEIQISELQGLLGKNPEYQLQGLQKLLEDAKPLMQNIKQEPLPLQAETSNIKVKPNSLPILPLDQTKVDDLQKQLDAVNQAHADAALAAAQKQAEAHVRAQHEAIALAQKKAEAEALAKIAAHNQGKALINPNDHVQIIKALGEHVTAAPLVAETPRPRKPVEAIIQQIEQNSIDSQNEKGEESAQVQHVQAPETLPLHGRPFGEVLLHQPHGGDRGYAPSFTDLRNSQIPINILQGNTVHQPHGDDRGYAPSFTDLSNSQPPINILQENTVRPAPFSKSASGPTLLEPAVSEVYAHSEVQNNAPVVPRPQRVPLPIQLNNHFRVVDVPNVPEHGQESYQQINIETLPSTKNQLYSEEQHQQYDDLHQYAPKYAFGYRVLDEKHGNDFGHEEERDGKLTKGYYFVLLPDGRRQKVDYYVDKGGYHARVTYENVGRHPALVHPQHHEEHRIELQPVIHHK